TGARGAAAAPDREAADAGGGVPGDGRGGRTGYRRPDAETGPSAGGGAAVKFWAILKDSFYEAVEGRIFQVLFVLALLVTVLVAGLSFQPLTVEEDLTQSTGFINGMMSLNPQAAGAKFLIENYKQTNDAPEPWKGNYQFEFVIPDVETAKKI